MGFFYKEHEILPPLPGGLFCFILSHFRRYNPHRIFFLLVALHQMCFAAPMEQKASVGACLVMQSSLH